MTTVVIDGETITGVAGTIAGLQASQIITPPADDVTCGTIWARPTATQGVGVGYTEGNAFAVLDTLTEGDPDDASHRARIRGTYDGQLGCEYLHVSSGANAETLPGGATVWFQPLATTTIALVLTMPPNTTKPALASNGWTDTSTVDADPPPPPIGTVRSWVRTVGGKTQLCARHHTGAIQVLSMQP